MRQEGPRLVNTTTNKGLGFTVLQNWPEVEAIHEPKDWQ
jgi:hypothetical protein